MSAILEICTDRVLHDLNDFEFDEGYIDSGGFGKIKRGKIKVTGQEVVYKAPKSSNILEINALIQEYNILCQCRHPLVELVIGFYHPDKSNEYGLITPYCELGSLANYISRNEPLGQNLVLKIITGIAFGMKYIHEQNISHRDLKPANVLIEKNNSPIIIDFGLSREYINYMHSQVGTPLYAAPEIIKNEEYTNKVDVYSYGLLVNELYSRHIPFTGLPHKDFFNEKCNKQFIISDKVPSSIKPLIELCVRLKPSERPDFKIIYEKLREIINKKRGCTNLSTFFNNMEAKIGVPRLFKIPKQILKTDINQMKTEDGKIDPINWDNFNSVFFSKEDDGRSCAVIMLLGRHQSGKTTFLRTITNNLAYYSGDGIFSTTKGIIMDGPYSVQQLIDNVQDDDYKQLLLQIDTNRISEVYFLDSQGTGDEGYEQNEKVIYEKIYSILCALSTVCISIPDSNTNYNEIQFIAKTLRRSQFYPSLTATKLLLLVKGVEGMDTKEDYDYNELSKLSKVLNGKFMEKYKKSVGCYHFSSLMPLPLGNVQNLDSYLNSVYFSLIWIFRLMTEVPVIISKTIFMTTLKFQISILFGELYQFLDKNILKNANKEASNKFLTNDMDNDSKEALTYCGRAFDFISKIILNAIIDSHDRNANIPQLMDNIRLYIEVTMSVYLPYELGNLDFPCETFWQYSYEMQEDFMSFLNGNSDKWKLYMRDLKNEKKVHVPTVLATTAAVIGTAFIPIVGPFISLGLSISSAVGWGTVQIVNIVRLRKLKKTFQPSFYPFIWKKNISLILDKINYDCNNPKKIGNNGDQLYIFFEQPNQDSSLLFRALTGFKVNSKKDSFSLLFENVSIQKFMERYKRHELPPDSMNYKNSHILYLKGCSQKVLTAISEVQNENTIFITSSNCLENAIKPPVKFDLYVFATFKHYFIYPVCDEISYIRDMYEKKIYLKFKTKVPSTTTILPLESNGNNFDDGGILCSALMICGCRYIYKDKELHTLYQNLIKE